MYMCMGMLNVHASRLHSLKLKLNACLKQAGRTASPYKFQIQFTYVLSGYCQVSSRLPLWHFMIHCVDQGNTSYIRKSYSERSRAHLAVSTEWVSSKTNESCLCKLSWPFTMGLYDSLYDCHSCGTNCYLAHITASNLFWHITADREVHLTNSLLAEFQVSKWT